MPSVLSYCKALSIDPAPEIKLATSRSAVKRFTDSASPVAGRSVFIRYPEAKNWVEKAVSRPILSCLVIR